MMMDNNIDNGVPKSNRLLKVRAIRLRNDNKTYVSIDDSDSYNRNLLSNGNVGKEIRVYQTMSRKWHAAAIVDCEHSQGQVYHKVVYADGKVSWINLKVEKVLIDDDGSLKASPIQLDSYRKKRGNAHLYTSDNNTEWVTSDDLAKLIKR